MTAENVILHSTWAILLLWVSLYVLDYYLTLLGAKYHAAGAKEHFAHEGSYELTPGFEAEVVSQRSISPLFLKHLIGSCVVFLILKAVAVMIPDLDWFYRFLVGGFVVRQIAVLMRHIRNLSSFYFAMSHEGIEGRISYERWYSYRLSAIDLAAYAGVFALVAILTGSVAFVGGFVVTGITAYEHYRMYVSVRRSSP